jgi:hypothetical protein
MKTYEAVVELKVDLWGKKGRMPAPNKATLQPFKAKNFKAALVELDRKLKASFRAGKVPYEVISLQEVADAQPASK